MKDIQLQDGLDTMIDTISQQSSKRPMCFYHTEVECRNELGELLFKKHNTILMGGRRFTLEKLFNVTSTSSRVVLKNGTLVEDNTSKDAEDGKGPAKEKCVCLFGVGDAGATVEFGTVAKPSADETNLYHLIPLRYVPTSEAETVNEDGNGGKLANGRYYMTAQMTEETGQSYTAFYLKTFNEKPIIVLKSNGAEYNPPTSNNAKYGDSNITYATADDVDAYVQLSLKINATDVREWYDETKENEQPRINELSLFIGEYNENTKDYDNVECFSKLTFNNEPLDGTKELNIIYRIYI